MITVARIGGLLLLLFGLAVYRVSRFLTQEELSKPWRLWVARRCGSESRWTYLVECPACMSIWIGAILAPVVMIWGENRVVQGALLALAASAVTVLLINKGEPNV